VHHRRSFSPVALAMGNLPLDVAESADAAE
jgi:hypothetical protein